MDLLQNYILLHQNDQIIFEPDVEIPNVIKDKVHNQCSYVIDRNLIFSHRKNFFTTKNFPEGLHSHEYYEVVLLIRGDVDYIKENNPLISSSGCLFWAKPGQMHTARLKSSSVYERYVFYISENTFSHDGNNLPLWNFLTADDNCILVFEPEVLIKAISLLDKTESLLKTNTLYSKLLTKTYITQLFALFDDAKKAYFCSSSHKTEMMFIKEFIDKNFYSIRSVSDVANKFHISREHLSRKFKNYFNISISDYISKRKVIESLPILLSSNVTNACYTVGFNSQSAYIQAFKKNMGCLPSDYRKNNCKTYFNLE